VASPSRAVYTTSPWPDVFRDREVVVVDLETTGGSARHDRVIEIAAVRVVNGQVRARWHQLVNPGTKVPSFIVGLTGISSGLVARAPSFAEVAEAFRAFVGDAILVAHHTAFDLAFLKREFSLLGEAPFDPPTLCTLKLSRRLFPGLPSHSLEALIQTLGLPIRRRHRALPDALAATDLLNRLVLEASRKDVGGWDELCALSEGPKRKRPRGTFERARLKELPSGPGVYLLKDSDSNVFYIGKSVNLRRRVGDHVRGNHDGQPRLRRQLTRLEDVQVIPTATELEALLLEARLIKHYLPVANQQLRDETHYPYIKIDVQSSYPRLELTRQPADDGSMYFGPFRSARLVGVVVEYLRGALGIRECNRPNLPDGKPCWLLELKKCLGPCIGAVDVAEYRRAIDRAISLLRGEWDEIIDGLEARMLALAENEQFELAAELRDVLTQIRTVMSTQHRLAELNAYHAVVVRRLDPDSAQLFFVQAGRLAHQATVSWPSGRRQVTALCRKLFTPCEPRPITTEGADEAWILSSWIRQRANSPDDLTITVDPADRAGMVKQVQRELDAFFEAPQAVPAGA
jgi:DNA polymerase III subunit epsilon